MPLTPKQVEALAQNIVMQILQTSDPKAVRIDWPTGGQPSWGIGDDVVFIGAKEDDDWYNRIREVHYPPFEGGGYGGGGYGDSGYGGVADVGLLTEVWTYTRAWNIKFTAYGPNSFDRMRTVKSAMFYQSVHDSWALSQMFMIPDLPALARAPELFADQWWERVDLDVRFYEAVEEDISGQSVKSVEIKVYDQLAPDINTPDIDITVISPNG